MNTVKPSFSTISLTLGEPMQELQNPRIDWSQSIPSSVLSWPCSFFSFLRLRCSFLEATSRLFYSFRFLSFSVLTLFLPPFCLFGCSCICLNLFHHKLIPCYAWAAPPLAFLCLPLCAFSSSDVCVYN